jgi:threonine synthase
MSEKIEGFSFDDDTTRAAIRTVQALHQYVIDPHGAIGWLAAKKWSAQNPGNATIVLETAHPSKFLDVMEAELGLGTVEIPERLACLADAPSHSIPISHEEAHFLAWLNQQSPHR